MATSSTAGAPKTPIQAASRTGVGWGSGGGVGGTKWSSFGSSQPWWSSYAVSGSASGGAGSISARSP